MAFRVVNATQAFERAVARGAKPAKTVTGPNELNIPAIEGIGGLQIYLVDRYGAKGSIKITASTSTGSKGAIRSRKVRASITSIT